MMTPKDRYRPPSQQDGDALSTRCGVFGFNPDILQPCAGIGFFTGFYSLAALMTSTLTIYVNSQITTLERQFGFTSRQTGLIMAANDVGYLVCVLFVSYSASRLHIPRSLGLTTVFFGLSGIVCCLPHFIYGARSSPAIDTFPSNNTVNTSRRSFSASSNLCMPGNSTNDDPMCTKKSTSSSLTSSTPEYVATVSLVIIFIGMMLQGFGKAPRYSFSVTYVDDNTEKIKTGFYMGIVTTMGIFGPAVAYLLGGMFSRIYVTLEKTNLHPYHPKWIGAWWLGYLVFGSVALVVALPLFCFPRKMPRNLDKETGEKTDDNGHIFSTPTHAKSNNIDSTLKFQTFWQKTLFHAKDFLRSMQRLHTNPVYLCMLGSACTIIFMVSSTSAYSPKYFERQFNLPAYKANYIMAGKTLFAACLGTFIGGYLTKRFKMTAMKALKFVILVCSISVLASAAGFIFYCDQPKVHNFPGETSECAASCNCQSDSFYPICGEDGKTYYSPCTAGCSSFDRQVYTNCSCIAGTGQASNGECPYTCNSLYPYAIFSAIRSLFGTLSIMPKIVIFIRCVAEKDRALALGASAFMTSLLGWLLGPIVMGSVIDGICTIWSVKCGRSGRCLLYDNDLFRIKLHGYASVAGALSLIFVIIAYCYARYTGCLDTEEEEIQEAEVELKLKLTDDMDNSMDLTHEYGNNDSLKPPENGTHAKLVDSSNPMSRDRMQVTIKPGLNLDKVGSGNAV